MAAISGDTYDLMCFEMINILVENKWESIINSDATEACKKIETLGYSIGYRWAQIQKIKNPAWNSINEVINDICTRFWEDCFGMECSSMHTDSSKIFVISCKTLRPLSKIQPCEGKGDRLHYYALLYKGMIDGILSLAGYSLSTSFRRNRHSGDFEFIVAVVYPSLFNKQIHLLLI